MPKTVTASKKTKNHRFSKVMMIIIAVILSIAIVASIFIGVVTRTQPDSKDNITYVGGMLSSDTIDYKSKNSGNLNHDPIIKMMQMIWYFCAEGDEKKHASQTPPDTECIKDIPYIDDGNLYHKLDVFYPKNTKPTEKLPVVIDIHGGGWMYATKDLNEYYCRAIADRGYVVFSISYRLVPDVIVPEQIQDVMAALDYISTNMSNYPSDANNVVLTGDSAGGMLAAYCASIMQSDELKTVFDVSDVNLNLTSLVLTSPVAFMKDGLINVYTKKLWGNDYKSSKYYNYMNLDEILNYVDSLPPTYLITGKADTLAHSQTLKADEVLSKKGVTTKLVDYDDKKYVHVYSVLFPFDEKGKETIDSALDFCSNYMSNTSIKSN